MITHGLMPLKTNGVGDSWSQVARQVSSYSTDPQSPQAGHASFEPELLPEQQAFYKQHVIPYLKKKKKVGKGEKINMCSKLQPVCRQNNFCLKRWLFSPILNIFFLPERPNDLLD